MGFSRQVQRVLLAFLVCASTSAAAAPVDDSRVRQLEQDVRTLQRLLDQQTRRIEALESAGRQSRTARLPAPNKSDASTPQKSDEQRAWRQRANWDKIRTGMPEAEVVKVIGPPTTARRSDDGNKQTLFYTMELEGGGFLSGNVVIGKQGVIEVHPPALR